MRRWAAWVPAALWAAGIFVLSSRPSLPVPGFSGADKAAHFGAYAVLGAFLAHGAAASGLGPAAPVALGWAYGASDELHQARVPGRSPDVWDWVADALGVVAGLVTYRRLFRSRLLPRTRAGREA
ncbi:MAG TPA: VanZ family protein [Longimicrobium sp.]|nr:VanZ family protein [Longimicrobium sp.]